MKRTALALGFLVLTLSGCTGLRPDGAMTVNGDVIAMDVYSAQLAADKGREVVAINTLVRRAVIEQMARQSKITVDAAAVDAAWQQLEKASGGPEALEEHLGVERLSKGQVRSLLRLRLLEQALLRRDPTHYATALGAALQQARVQVFVGPCAKQHEYPRCVLNR